MFEAQSLWKSFGQRLIVRDASLTLKRGERVVVLGDNGSGKSTFLSMVGGVLQPDRGQIEVCNSLGFAPERPDLPDHLRVAEWLDLVASLKGLRRGFELPFGVRELLFERTSALSLGQRQRVSLASTWLGSPDLLVLDEPTNGLDAETRAEVIERLSTGSSLIATHDRALAAAVATRVVTMQAGVLCPWQAGANESSRLV